MKRLPNVLLMKNADYEAGRRFIAGISEYAQHFGPWRIHWVSEREEGPPAPLTWDDMDGVIGTNKLNLEAVKRTGVPVIVECTTEIEFPGMISVMSDDAVLGRVAADHFLERGFRNFAFFGGTSGTYEHHREQAFRAALKAEGFDLHAFFEPDDASARQKQMMHWMANLPKPLAVLTANDEYAKSVLEVCGLAAIRVPEECAVLGMDNDEMLCNLCNPPLSSIKIPFRKAGYEAAAQLDRMMRGEEAETDLIMIEAGDVVVRQSTDTVAVDDPAAAYRCGQTPTGRDIGTGVESRPPLRFQQPQPLLRHLPRPPRHVTRRIPCPVR